MIPIISSMFFLLSGLDPINNFVSLKTYVSQNAQEHLKIYFINEDIPDYLRVNIMEKSRGEFIAYLDSVGIECKQLGSYWYIRKKSK